MALLLTPLLLRARPKMEAGGLPLPTCKPALIDFVFALLALGGTEVL